MAIEKKFITQNLKEFQIKEFVANSLSRVGLSDIKLQRTPLGDKILVTASRPGLVVGRGGSNIQRLTAELKEKFNLENPQIEIEEVAQIGLDPNIIAEMIVNSLERYGTNRFKGVGHRAMSDIMNAGALGVEILISGKVPSQRSRVWRFYQGHLKKCGDIAVEGVLRAQKTAVLKTGAVGVKVSILPPSTKLPDEVEIHEATIEEIEMVGLEKKEKPVKAEGKKSEAVKVVKEEKSGDKQEVKTEKKEEAKEKKAEAEPAKKEEVKEEEAEPKNEGPAAPVEKKEEKSERAS